MGTSDFDAARGLALLTDSVKELDGCTQDLASSFRPPLLVELHGSWALRHAPDDQNDLLLSYLKLVKVASHNNAAMVLLAAGYVHEVYALCRMIFEACEDIIYMTQPAGDDGQPTAKQVQFYQEFYQEEFSGPDLVESQEPRNRVTRKDIRATLAKRADNAGLDAERDKKLGAVLYGTFSGFVHGAYGHLMELFDGAPLRPHTTGMVGTRRVHEGVFNQVSYVYRSLLQAEMIARRAGRNDVVLRALDAAIELATRTGCISGEGLQKMKARRARPIVPPS